MALLLALPCSDTRGNGGDNKIPGHAGIVSYIIAITQMANWRRCADAKSRERRCVYLGRRLDSIAVCRLRVPNKHRKKKKCSATSNGGYCVVNSSSAFLDSCRWRLLIDFNHETKTNEGEKWRRSSINFAHFFSKCVFFSFSINGPPIQIVRERGKKGRKLKNKRKKWTQDGHWRMFRHRSAASFSQCLIKRQISNNRLSSRGPSFSAPWASQERPLSSLHSAPDLYV